MGTSSRPNEIAKWAYVVRQNKEAMNMAETARKSLEPSQWLAQSVEDLAEVRLHSGSVPAARSGANKVEMVDLSEAYLKDSGAVANRRMEVAGLRLGKLLSEDLK